MGSAIQVVAAILYYQNAVLLCKRKLGRTFPGFWEFPGGKVEPSETPAEAIARELAEELFLSIPYRRFDYFTSNQIDYHNQTYQLHFFTTQITAKPTESTDHNEFRFFTQLELAQFLGSNPPIMTADRLPAQQLVEKWTMIFSK
jgi:8-oxo-dGTP diphosphatase